MIDYEGDLETGRWEEGRARSQCGPNYNIYMKM